MAELVNGSWQQTIVEQLDDLTVHLRDESIDINITQLRVGEPIDVVIQRHYIPTKVNVNINEKQTPPNNTDQYFIDEGVAQVCRLYNDPNEKKICIAQIHKYVWNQINVNLPIPRPLTARNTNVTDAIDDYRRTLARKIVKNINKRQFNFTKR